MVSPTAGLSSTRQYYLLCTMHNLRNVSGSCSVYFGDIGHRYLAEDRQIGLGITAGKLRFASSGINCITTECYELLNPAITQGS